MKKIMILSVLFFSAIVSAAQKSSLTIKAFQRYHIGGLPPGQVIEVGGKEVITQPKSSEPEYFIYLLAYKMPSLKIESVWIKKNAYTASINKVACKPVILNNGIQTDTLVRYTDEDVWRILITGKRKNYSKPAKNMATLVTGNELVLQLSTKSGTRYTRAVKYIATLESTRGQ